MGHKVEVKWCMYCFLTCAISQLFFLYRHVIHMKSDIFNVQLDTTRQLQIFSDKKHLKSHLMDNHLIRKCGNYPKWKDLLKQ